MIRDILEEAEGQRDEIIDKIEGYRRDKEIDYRRIEDIGVRGDKRVWSAMYELDKLWGIFEAFEGVIEAVRLVAKDEGRRFTVINRRWC